jgi:transposase-like protein
MPRPYPPEFRARAIALVRAGKQAKQTAVELGIHPVTLSKWLRQDDIDNGRLLVSHRAWSPNGGAGQPVTRTCIRPYAAADHVREA